jgi:membrane associated rhomboid family serine protease
VNILKPIRRPFKYSFRNAGLILIGINAGVFALTSIFPGLYRLLALSVFTVVKYRMYWQLVTYMFVHAGLPHLFFNMLGLLFFGVSAEKAVGSKEFVLFYMLAGTLSGIASFAAYFFSGWYGIGLVGASGAVYAVLLLYAVVYPRSRIFIWGILPVPAPLLVLIYVGAALFNQVFSVRNGVAHLTHLAGFVAAWIYIRARMGISPLKVWKSAFF